MPYQIELPLPYANCSPNRGKAHWGAKNKVQKQYRDDCYWVYREAMLHGRLPVAFRGPIILHLDFYLCRKAFVSEGLYFPRDRDNARASFKGGQDALVRVGVIPDDTHRRVIPGRTDIHSSAQEHKGRMCVVLTIEEVAN